MTIENDVESEYNRVARLIGVSAAMAIGYWLWAGSMPCICGCVENEIPFLFGVSCILSITAVGMQNCQRNLRTSGMLMGDNER